MHKTGQESHGHVNRNAFYTFWFLFYFFSVATAVVEPFGGAGAGAAAATRKIIYINIRAVNCVLWHVKWQKHTKWRRCHCRRCCQQRCGTYVTAHFFRHLFPSAQSGRGYQMQMCDCLRVLRCVRVFMLLRVVLYMNWRSDVNVMAAKVFNFPLNCFQLSKESSLVAHTLTRSRWSSTKPRCVDRYVRSIKLHTKAAHP